MKVSLRHLWKPSRFNRSVSAFLRYRLHWLVLVAAVAISAGILFFASTPLAPVLAQQSTYLPVGTGRDPDIALSDGDIHVVYVNGRDIWYSKVPASGGTPEVKKIGTSGLSAGSGNSPDPHVAVDGNGTPHFVWNAGGNLVYKKGTGNGGERTISSVCGTPGFPPPSGHPCFRIWKPRIGINGNDGYVYFEDRWPFAIKIDVSQGTLENDRTLVAPNTSRTYDGGAVAVDGTGVAHFTFRTSGGLFYRSLRRSGDLTRVVELLGGGASDFSDITLDGNDTVLISGLQASNCNAECSPTPACTATPEDNSIRLIGGPAGGTSSSDFYNYAIPSTVQCSNVSCHDSVGSGIGVSGGYAYIAWSSGNTPSQAWFLSVDSGTDFEEGSLGEPRPLGEIPSDQGGKLTFPEVDGSFAVWEDNYSGAYQIFVRDLSVPSTSTLTCSGGTTNDDRPCGWPDSRAGVWQCITTDAAKASAACQVGPDVPPEDEFQQCKNHQPACLKILEEQDPQNPEGNYCGGPVNLAPDATQCAQANADGTFTCLGRGGLENISNEECQRPVTEEGGLCPVDATCQLVLTNTCSNYEDHPWTHVPPTVTVPPVTIQLLGQNISTFGQLIQHLFTLSLQLLGITVFVMILFAGFQWMTAAGNTALVGKARSRMTNALLGALLLLSAYLILNTINPDLVSQTFTLPAVGTGGTSNNSSAPPGQNGNLVCVNGSCTNGVNVSQCTSDNDCDNCTLPAEQEAAFECANDTGPGGCQGNTTNGCYYTQCVPAYCNLDETICNQTDEQAVLAECVTETCQGLNGLGFSTCVTGCASQHCQ